MKFDELINLAAKKADAKNQPAINHVRSYQYQLSLKILGARIKNELTQREAANKVGISLKDYKSFENGINTKANKKEYYSILDKLEKPSAQEKVIFDILSDISTIQNTNISVLDDKFISMVGLDVTQKHQVIQKLKFTTKKQKGEYDNATNLQGLSNQEDRLYVGKFANA